MMYSPKLFSLLFYCCMYIKNKLFFKINMSTVRHTQN